VQQPFSISNEAEFRRWLAVVLASERERLRAELTVNDFPRSTNFEVVWKHPTKETQHHEDQR
jgi:hypothetical protein